MYWLWVKGGFEGERQQWKSMGSKTTPLVKKIYFIFHRRNKIILGLINKREIILGVNYHFKWSMYSPNMALTEPAISTASEPLYMWTSMIPERMVLLTLAPKRMAPTVSNMVARMQAWRRVTTPEPTAVPKELATSLAPTENARIKAMTKPSTSSQRTPDMSVCEAAVSIVTVARDASVVDSIAAVTLLDYCELNWVGLLRYFFLINK